MSNIQALIKQYAHTKSNSIMDQLIKELHQQELMWVAFSPITHNHYTDYLKNLPTAYMFSEKRFCEAFQKHLAGKGVTIESLESRSDGRVTLFSDFFRSGIEQVIIDNGQTFVVIEMSKIVKQPDFSTLPEDERPILNRSLMLHANRCFQRMPVDITEPVLTPELKAELFASKYLLPMTLNGKVPKGSVLIKFSTGTAVIDIPSVRLGVNRACIPLFTDWAELTKLDSDRICTGNVVTFTDLEAICAFGQTVVINPFGFGLFLDAETIAAIRAGSTNEPATEPATIPEVVSEPATIPAAAPVPTPAPAAVTEPAPDPAAVPVPTTAPAAVTEPATVPAAVTETTPAPTAVTETTPAPAAVPEPAPIPAAAPVPTTAPAAVPVPTTAPAAAPVPTTVPAAAPVPTTAPAAVPEPATAPNSQPKGIPDDITLFELRSVPNAFIRRLIELLSQTEGIQRAFLKGITKGQRSGYLAVVEFSGTDPKVFQEIAKETGPLTEGMPLTFVSFDSPIGNAAAKDAYPFYQRKQY